MERGRIPYTQSELSDSHMYQPKARRPRPGSANLRNGADVESNDQAHLSALDLDRSTPLWQQYYHLWIRIPILSTYHTLRVGIPTLFVWTALFVRRVAVAPTLLDVVVHGVLLFLFWYISFAIVDLTHYDHDPAPWISRLWGSLCCFEFLFSIYVIQSLLRRFIKKIWTGDPVSPFTLLVCSS